MLSVILLFLATISLSLADTCGGNCPSDDCPAGQCDCGDSPNDVDPSQYCSEYSDWSQDCCNCIANAESGGNANAENYNTNGSTDIGLYQVNSINWSACSGGSPPCDPDTNTACAHQIWQWGGNTWKLWSTCGQCGCCGSP